MHLKIIGYGRILVFTVAGLIFVTEGDSREERV